jgi:hypothetical protein
VDIMVNKTTSIAGGVYDRRPSQVEGFVKGSTAGFYLDNASNIVIRNSSVRWGINTPEYFRHALQSKQVPSLVLTNFSGSSAFPKKIKALSRN